MSVELMNVAPTNVAQCVDASREHFLEIEGELSYEKEKVFAVQQLSKTDFAKGVALKNPGSVRMAMYNVASMGLTLNPAHAFAYLVPRDGAILLDVSYKGMLKVATDTGSIKFAKADLVYANDTFVYNGPIREPVHTANPFNKDRGEIIGCYCIAKTHEGEYLVETLDREELEKIRSKSMAYAKSKSGPWVEYFGEMCKKATIKRASKTWPYTVRMEKMYDVIEQANEAEGGYQLEVAPEMVSDEQAIRIDEWLETTGIDKAEFLGVMNVGSVSAIPKIRFQEAVNNIKAKADAVKTEVAE